MKCNFIATWKMAKEAVEIANKMLKDNEAIENVLEKAICNVEDNPKYVSVGFGGLPNMNGEVELDAAYMNGSTIEFGAVAAVKNIKNPIKVAIELSKNMRNILLIGKGAEKYAEEKGFEFKNMLTEYSKKRWIEKSISDFDKEKMEAYGGHDTVCMIGKDYLKNMAIGVSTSGLFMKKPGRVGDSPIIGGGLYCTEIGAAAATGVGEDIMKGCLSYEIVRKISEGIHPQVACEETLKEHLKRFEKVGHQVGSMSVIALDKDGNYGAATTKKEFPFVVSDEESEVKLLVAKYNEGKTTVFEADAAWLEQYTGD